MFLQEAFGCRLMLMLGQLIGLEQIDDLTVSENLCCVTSCFDLGFRDRVTERVRSPKGHALLIALAAFYEMSHCVPRRGIRQPLFRTGAERQGTWRTD